MQRDNILDTKLNDVDLKSKIRGFIEVAKHGEVDKDEVLDYYQAASRKASECRMMSSKLRALMAHWGEDLDHHKTIYASLISKYNTKAEVVTEHEKWKKEANEWMKICEELDAIRCQYKNFNKSVCFSNIRELLKDNPDVKIGQIEQAAGIRLGYMSRLEKMDNTAEPSVEFIVTAAKLLNVSVDTLITMDLANLTPTEKYLVSFIEKLKSDTIQDKINWSIETPFELSRCGVDCNGESEHPLFSVETFYRESECEYPDEVTENVYVSKTFGPNTAINGDCYNLRLKNGSIFYLMDLVKDVHRVGDKAAFVKEAVMYVPYRKTQVLATTKDEYPIGPLLEELFLAVKERMKHPQVSNDVMTAIDAFMKNDLEDDPEELPF